MHLICITGTIRQSSSSNWNSTSSSASHSGYPLCYHSPCRVPNHWIYCWPHAEKSGTTPPVAPLLINTTSRPMSTPKMSRLGVPTALHRAMKICPHWSWRLGPAPNHRGRNLPVPFQSNKGHHWSWWWYCSGKLKAYWGSGQWEQHQPQWGLIWLRCVQGECGHLWYGVSLPGLVSCLWAQKRYLSETLTRSTERGYRLPVA